MRSIFGRQRSQQSTQAYFDKCLEKLGLIPNVLLAYAFDERSCAPSPTCTTS